METVDISIKGPTRRSRAKSVGLAYSPQPITDVNVNGEEESNVNEKPQTNLDKSIEAGSVTEDKNESENKVDGKIDDKPVQESKPTKPAQGRKRKASEMKSSDENTSDEPPVKDKPPEDNLDVSIEEKDDRSIVGSDIGISSDMETLGKGKRARIPNKRYSDFPLKSSRTSQSELMDVDAEKPKTNLENGDAKEIPAEHEANLNADLTLKDDGSENSTSSSPNIILKANPSLRTNRTASPSTPGTKKTKPPVDLTNPNYLKPFQYGWKRELVYRATTDSATNKRNGDIYYYTPNGRKVRSMREVSENLKNKELTLDDFTFFKEPLGLDDPEKEIIRDAKIKSTSSTPVIKKSTPKVTRTPKIASPKSTPSQESSSETTKPKVSTRKASFKIKLPTRAGASPQNKSKTEKRGSKNDSDLSIGTYPPEWSSPVTKKPIKTANNSTIQVSEGTSPTAISENILFGQQRPQHVEFLGKKQFLIIPKQNILAISPNIPTSATAPSSKSLTNNVEISTAGVKVATEGSTIVASTPDSASLGPPVEVSTIKTEPPSPLKSTEPNPTSIQEPMETESSESDKIQDDNFEKRSQENLENDQENKRKKQKQTPAVQSHTTHEPEDVKFMDSYLQNVAYGYSTLLYVFQYLKMQDLLRASCVCSMWRDIASHPMLWRTVRMKNSQIHSFEGLADALEKHGTAHLDLRKMLLPSTSNDDIWHDFSRAIKKVESLRKIELCRCPATVVEQLALSNPKLEVINSVTIKCESMSLAPLVFLKNLQELRLKSTAGFSLTSDLTALSDLKQLKHLSLTSIKEMNKLNIDVIADLRNLESLELGECTDFPKTFGSEILTRLNKLEKLRLEKGQGNCYTFEVLEAVKNMPHLYQLELVNFDIKPGFDLALGACPNIKKLLIIPTYISQSATTNHMVLGGVLRLQSTLAQFVWGVTLELLRVTELFVDQCEEDKEKKEKRPIANGDSIPVLKPVPLAREGMAAEILPAQEPPQVEILPLPNLQKLLLSSLPTTRVKILKIPFHATWRQSIHDSVN